MGLLPPPFPWWALGTGAMKMNPAPLFPQKVLGCRQEQAYSRSQAKRKRS